MSQAGIISTSGGPVPPAVPTTFVTDVNSPSVPIANIENLIGGTTTTNNNNGIQTDGSSGSNTLTVQLTNRIVGTVTTNSAANSTLVSLPLGATPGAYIIRGSVGGFISASNSAAGYFFEGTAKTDGATATLVGGEFTSFQEDAAFSGSTAFVNFDVSGNNAVIIVTGIAATTINWISKMEFIKVT